MLFGGKVGRGVFERFSEERFFLLRPQFVKALVSLREEIETRLFVGFAVRKRFVPDNYLVGHGVEFLRSVVCRRRGNREEQNACRENRDEKNCCQYSSCFD